MAGSIFFMISAIAAFVRPATDEVVSARIDNSGTFLGAVCFLWGAWLLLTRTGGQRSRFSSSRSDGMTEAFCGGAAAGSGRAAVGDGQHRHGDEQCGECNENDGLDRLDRPEMRCGLVGHCLVQTQAGDLEALQAAIAAGSSGGGSPEVAAGRTLGQ